MLALLQLSPAYTGLSESKAFCNQRLGGAHTSEGESDYGERDCTQSLRHHMCHEGNCVAQAGWRPSDVGAAHCRCGASLRMHELRIALPFFLWVIAPCAGATLVQWYGSIKDAEFTVSPQPDCQPKHMKHENTESMHIFIFLLLLSVLLPNHHA